MLITDKAALGFNSTFCGQGQTLLNLQKAINFKKYLQDNYGYSLDYVLVTEGVLTNSNLLMFICFLCFSPKWLINERTQSQIQYQMTE